MFSLSCWDTRTWVTPRRQQGGCSALTGSIFTLTRKTSQMENPTSRQCEITFAHAWLLTSNSCGTDFSWSSYGSEQKPQIAGLIKYFQNLHLWLFGGVNLLVHNEMLMGNSVPSRSAMKIIHKSHIFSLTPFIPHWITYWSLLIKLTKLSNVKTWE